MRDLMAEAAGWVGLYAVAGFMLWVGLTWGLPGLCALFLGCFGAVALGEMRQAARQSERALELREQEFARAQSLRRAAT